LSAGAGPVCAGCLDDLPWLSAVCDRCGLPLPKGLARCPPGDCELSPGSAVTRLWAPLAYEYPVDRLVQRAKFGRSLPACHALAELLVAGLQRSPAVGLGPDGPPVVLPVPLHWQRQRQRGFNQAAEIARVIARARGWPLAPRWLRRIRPTREQSGLPAAVRRRNLRDAFAVGGPVAGHNVLLVDDVITTGATATAAAAVLAAAGAASIHVWAVARACRHGPEPHQGGGAAPRA
jgi:ComF family protein